MGGRRVMNLWRYIRPSLLSQRRISTKPFTQRSSVTAQPCVKEGSRLRRQHLKSYTLPSASSRHITMSQAECKGHDWGYDDQSAWGKVAGWEIACSGKRQSPINIQTHLVGTNRELQPLKLNGWDSVQDGKFQNTGHSIQFSPSTSTPPTLITPHGSYAFKQFHFHWGPTSQKGSEHCIDGDSYASEIHFVHCKMSGTKDAPDSLAVLGVFCNADHEYKSRDTPWEQLKVPQESGQTIEADGLDISKLLPSELDYYHYRGSLTTPPCSERVMWYIVKQPIKVPEEFLEKLRQIKDVSGHSLTHNYRQCMPVCDRLVETPEK